MCCAGFVLPSHPRVRFEQAPTPELRALTEQYPPLSPPRPPPLRRELTIARCAASDLRRAEIDPAIEELDLTSVKSISGWEALRTLHRLECFQISKCKSAEMVALAPRLPVGLLWIYACDNACFETVIRSTSAESIDAHHTATPTLDLSIFRGHGHLRRRFFAVVPNFGFACRFLYVTGTLPSIPRHER